MYPWFTEHQGPHARRAFKRFRMGPMRPWMPLPTGATDPITLRPSGTLIFSSLCGHPTRSPMRHSVSDITAIIRDRRTIQPKDYSQREVQRDVIDTVLGNAIWAPTHGMTQPWRFTVFTGKGREKLKPRACSTLRCSASPFA